MSLEPPAATDTAALSLLSLSIAASHAAPIPLPDPAPPNSKHQPAQSHHRRLSSTGRRRRLSDARDAATRPLSAGGPALSMAALSLSSASPPPHAVAMPASAPTKSSTPIPIASAGRKKRGVDHKCESCSKIYRHPSCLIKHRWEHTPHWRTLSSLPHPAAGGGGAVLSKHAQVQLLEAAAILSHLSPDSETGTSLPEDRGMWPRWVSGGALEGEEGVTPASYESASVYSSAYGEQEKYAAQDKYAAYGSQERYGSAGHYGFGHGHGPRLHDYEVPRGAEVRAGVVEVPHEHEHGWSVSPSASASRSRSTPSDDGEGDGVGGGGRRVWKREEEEEFGFEFELGGVREEEGEDEGEGMDEEMGMSMERGEGRGRKCRERRVSGRRWAGMEEMEDIDMDMD